MRNVRGRTSIRRPGFLSGDDGGMVTTLGLLTVPGGACGLFGGHAVNVLGGGVGLPLGVDQAVQRCGVILDGSAEIGGAIAAVGRQPFQGLSEIVCGLITARWCHGLGGGLFGPYGGILTFTLKTFGIKAAAGGGQTFGVSAIPWRWRRRLNPIRPGRTRTVGTCRRWRLVPGGWCRWLGVAHRMGLPARRL